MSHFQPWPWPRVLAHRGAGALAPENTLAALRIGWNHGFRAVEFDAMLPRDEVPVLMHDATLMRTTGQQGDVTARSAGELTVLDAGAWHSPAFAGEPIPTLVQALDFCREHSIWPNVEIKPAPGHEVRTGAAVARVVASAYADLADTGGGSSAGPHARIPLLSSFSVPALEAARAAEPALPRALLVERIERNWEAAMERLGAASLHVSHRHLTAVQAAHVKRAGYWLFCYTVNEPQRARELLDWGADAFCTDRIDRIGPDFA
ncbi:MAG TPA: glycerophosphodiester phosphodiesterase [Burkholderiaceae bacterium]|nr:glycerophosphodiester phosphodiesterase [Burkholderiaceae bacterium]